MKNLALYSLIVMAFVLAITLMFVRVPVSPDFANSKIPARAPAPPVKSVSLSAPQPDLDSTPLPTPPVPGIRASTSANSNAYEEPAAPGTIVLTIPGAVGEAAIPVVMVVKKTDSDLNPDQRDRIDAIAQTFTKEMTSGNVNPSDPAYLARWQKAQAEADESLRAALGEDIYFKYSLQAGIMSSN